MATVSKVTVFRREMTELMTERLGKGLELLSILALASTTSALVTRLVILLAAV